jgi:hypothetical protein
VSSPVAHRIGSLVVAPAGMRVPVVQLRQPRAHVDPASTGIGRRWGRVSDRARQRLASFGSTSRLGQYPTGSGTAASREPLPISATGLQSQPHGSIRTLCTASNHGAAIGPEHDPSPPTATPRAQPPPPNPQAASNYSTGIPSERHRPLDPPTTHDQPPHSHAGRQRHTRHDAPDHHSAHIGPPRATSPRADNPPAHRSAPTPRAPIALPNADHPVHRTTANPQPARSARRRRWASPLPGAPCLSANHRSAKRQSHPARSASLCSARAFQSALSMREPPTRFTIHPGTTPSGRPPLPVVGRRCDQSSAGVPTAFRYLR